MQIALVIAMFGVAAIAVTAWAWHRRNMPVIGALTAFFLGPSWGAFLYSLVFCTDGSPDAWGLLVGFSLGIGGLYVGVPAGLFLAVLQIFARIGRRY
ncbi:hypothetical protein [Bythopirellula goksoeyrii]|uniref:Uncharacterized protein n=1 Tax=Bythopirellula goksoeyrii TaxID=1400387 RepID=A0A5B9QAQ8_9BACT|nr:hypothetical protein [Bythopirellula goksoeyrii]QEG35968.1 hypothetical protein Pr1d_32770 [Bythopirellula goksoeyrii]